MSEHDQNLPAVEGDPIADPGLPAHTWRPTDVDKRAEKRAERQVATFFGLSTLFAVLFVVAYFTFQVGEDADTLLGFGASTVTLGATLGLALLLLGIGIIQWARKLMADHELVEYRHPARSSDEDRRGHRRRAADRPGRVRHRSSSAGAQLPPGCRRRRSACPAVVLLRDLGPLPFSDEVVDPENGGGLEHTIWKAGERVVRDVLGTPIKVSDLEVGDLVNAQPAAIFEVDENGHHVLEGAPLQVAKSKASLILLRMDPDDITPGKGRENWTVDGIVAYSKICTHVGCPISLNERTTHHLLCPCHQSTFDLADSARVVFGPAARALPQLPLAVDSEGYLIAQSDFTEPVGPSYWERDSK